MGEDLQGSSSMPIVLDTPLMTKKGSPVKETETIKIVDENTP